MTGSEQTSGGEAVIDIVIYQNKWKFQVNKEKVKKILAFKILLLYLQ